jgi:hypothetical protein
VGHAQVEEFGTIAIDRNGCRLGVTTEVHLAPVRVAYMRVGDAGTMDETERPRELSPDHREEDSDPSASAIARDATFYAAMRRAAIKGQSAFVAVGFLTT